MRNTLSKPCPNFPGFIAINATTNLDYDLQTLSDLLNYTSDNNDQSLVSIHIAYHKMVRTFCSIIVLPLNHMDGIG